MWVYLNDRIVQAERARVSVFDYGFLYGDGVFETVRIHDGRPVWLDRHLARLADACKQIRLPLPDKPWPAIFQKVIEKNRVDHAAIRLTLSRGTMFPSPLSAFSEKEGESLPRTLSSTFLIGDRSGGQDEGDETGTVVLFHRPLPHVTPSQRRKGIRLTLTTIRRPSPMTGPMQAKTLNYLNSLLAKQEAAERGAFDGLMVTTNGYVAECSMNNVFFIKNRTLYTPSLACGVLPGITRGVVLDMAPLLGLQPREGRYRPAFLYEADECFLTGSGIGILPVQAIDGHSFPRQTARSRVAAIQTRYDHLLKAHGR
ncbi:MAG: aminotransferase class IV [Nitrospira sp.]|nr:aminotransferase class IV [Nitrospira sp.]